MNSLSWFLYLADVIGNVQGVLVVATFVMCIMTFVGGVATMIGDDRYNPKEKAVGHYLRHCWKFTLALAVVAAMIPSRDTIYLIAGSEAGEAVVTSEAGKEILLDIQEVIQHQLNQLKGPTGKSSTTP